MSLDTVPIGRTGLHVSELAIGTWRFGRETADGEVDIKRDRAYELLDVFADHGGTSSIPLLRTATASPRS